MGDRDWLAEARCLLADAAGINDNAAAAVPDEYEMQRRRFLDRLHGYLAAQGDGVAAAFGQEVRRVFGTPAVENLDRRQLAELVRRFDSLMRGARLLASMPARNG